MDYPIDKRLIFVVDGEAYEKEEKPKEIVGLYEILVEIFYVFLNDVSIVPCVNIEGMRHIIAARGLIPGMILIDIKKGNDLKIIVDLKQAFPRTKIFVFSTDNSIAIAEEASEVTVISTKRINISNLFEGVSFLNK